MKDLKYSILINKASSQFEKRGFECILVILLALFSIVLLGFVPVAGIALGVFASAFLCVGVKRYLICVVENKFIPVESIFETFKICVKAFCLKFAYMLISFLWGLVFIIPGIITMLNYSLSSFVLADNNELGSLECMVKSKKLVNGYRLEIFIIYLCYFFVTLFTACVFSALGIVIKNFTTIPIWGIIVSMGLLFLFILLVFIIPYFELSFANVYVILKNNEQKQNKKTSAIKNAQTESHVQTKITSKKKTTN